MRGEDAAWRNVRARDVPWGLVEQANAKRRCGGLARLVETAVATWWPGFYESPTAGAALDHVVGPGDLEVAGRHERRRAGGGGNGEGGGGLRAGGEGGNEVRGEVKRLEAEHWCLMVLWKIGWGSR